MIKLISTGCKNCDILQRKMETKGIKFELEKIDIDTAIARGYKSMPILQVEQENMDFIQGMRYINGGV